MDSIEALISWAKAQGVELHGIAPKHIQGRGIGFVATRRLEVGPFQFLWTIDQD